MREMVTIPPTKRPVVSSFRIDRDPVPEDVFSITGGALRRPTRSRFPGRQFPESDFRPAGEDRRDVRAVSRLHVDENVYAGEVQVLYFGRRRFS